MPNTNLTNTEINIVSPGPDVVATVISGYAKPTVFKKMLWQSATSKKELKPKGSDGVPFTVGSAESLENHQRLVLQGSVAGAEGERFHVTVEISQGDQIMGTSVPVNGVMGASVENYTIVIIFV